MSICCTEVLDFVRSLSPERCLGGEEGVIYGPECASADRLLVAWMPTVSAIRHALDKACGIILSHEALTFHDYFGNSRDDAPWTADRARLSLLKQGNISVIRAHSTVDPTHVVPGFIGAVGLSEPLQKGAVWSYHEEEPILLRNLARRVANGMGMESVRLTGDPDSSVTRVGTMVGGLGLDRHILSWEHNLMHRNIEVLIAGETNDFAQRFAIDSEIALIETCHSASEEPGLEALARDLQVRFGEATVIFHTEAVPWRTISR